MNYFTNSLRHLETGAFLYSETIPLYKFIVSALLYILTQILSKVNAMIYVKYNDFGDGNGLS